MTEPATLFAEKSSCDKGLDSASAVATQEMGRRFAQGLRAGDVVAFFGGLGSGKTTMIKGICTGLNCTDLVSSPTFTLIHEYQGRLPIYHFDFYRVASATDALALDLDAYFDGDGVCLIEWSEKVLALLPAHRFEVHLQNNFAEGRRDSRTIRFETG